MTERPETVATGENREEQISTDKLLVHVHISKTGGSTLNHILRSSYGARHCPAEPWDSQWGPDPFTLDDLRRLRKLYPNLRSIAGHRLYGYVDLEDRGIEASYFALMREPVKACASRFQYKVERGPRSFDELEAWLQKDWIRNRHVKAIAGTDNAEDAIEVINQRNIFMGLTEKYDHTVVLLQRLLAPDLDISYERVNVADKKDVSQQLLGEEKYRAMIEEAQSADLELYKYVKEVLWPKYARAYGDGLEADVEKFAADRGSFNQLNIFKSRLKAYAVYKPALYLHRRRSG